MDGVWSTRNGEGCALLVAQTRAPGWDIEGQEKALAALERAFDTAARQGGGAQMRFSSPGAMTVASRTLIAADVTRLSLAASVLILGILFWVYRSVPVVALCFSAGRHRPRCGHCGGERVVRHRARHHARLRSHVAGRGGRLPEFLADTAARW